MRLSDDTASASTPFLDERVSAFHQCVAVMRQSYPNMSVTTYNNREHSPMELVQLCKIVTGLGETVRWLTYDACDDSTTADNIPGGLRSTAGCAGRRVAVEMRPLLTGRERSGGERAAWEGAALVEMACEGETVWMKLGGGSRVNLHRSPCPTVMGTEAGDPDVSLELRDATAFLYRKDLPIVTALRSNLDWQAQDGALVGRARGKAWVLVAFAESEARAAELVRLSPENEKARAEAYYRQRLENWRLETPDAALNEAFSHALLNVEYAWFRPYGWIESFHHWPTFWHMEHTAAEEWAGNGDRTPECLRSQLRKLIDGDKVPDMCPTGEGRRDWGGNNQFFFRCVDHYLKMTKDLAFAQEVLPAMRRILRQTFREYDPTGTGVLGWGTQIGNQEDFESTQGPGAAPGSEGVRMLEIMAAVERLLGHAEEADRYTAWAATALRELKRRVWRPELGRFGWYEDVLGNSKLETTYHGICYPILYDYVDAVDKASSIDHLATRLSGPEGEVYQSNHFGDHLYDTTPTWGMECGSDMQPFATAAYAKAGRPNDAIRPLQFIARRVCGEYQRGSWPETANERRFAYFSPSAAVFSQAVIESVFGLQRDLPADVTTIAPAFPDDWETASLTLPEVFVRYTRKGEHRRLELRLPEKTQKRLLWRLPPCGQVSVKSDGRPAPVQVRPCCGWFEVQAELGRAQCLTVELDCVPFVFSVEFPANAACGEEVALRAAGARVVGQTDRQGLFAEAYRTETGYDLLLRSDLLRAYEPFGWFGLMNFARRSFVVWLEQEGVRFAWPVCFAVLPPWKARGEYRDGAVLVELVNSGRQAMEGTASLTVRGHVCSARLQVAPRSRGSVRFAVPAAVLLPGQNAASLCLPDGSSAPLVVEYDVPCFPAPVPLDAGALMKPENWREIGYPSSHGHMTLHADDLMRGLFERDEVVLGGIHLQLNHGGFLPVCTRKQRNATVSLQGITAGKLYLLIGAFCDNHEVFGEVLRVEAEAAQQDAFLRPIYRRTLCLPGDLDMIYGNRTIWGVATYVPDTQRGEEPLLPYETGTPDYAQAQPPVYPQRWLWTQNRTVEQCDTVLNLIELDFGRQIELKELRLSGIAADAGGALLAVAYM